MIEKRLAHTALRSPTIIPLVYCVLNLKINAMPVMKSRPDNISNFEIGFLVIIGSKTAVNKVMDERQTRLTATVDNLIDAKNNIQWAPTKTPVTASLKKVRILN